MDDVLSDNERRDALTNLFMFGDKVDHILNWSGLGGTTGKISSTPTKVLSKMSYNFLGRCTMKLTRAEKRLPKRKQIVLRRRYKQIAVEEERGVDIDLKQGQANLEKFDWVLNVANR